LARTTEFLGLFKLKEPVMGLPPEEWGNFNSRGFRKTRPVGPHSTHGERSRSPANKQFSKKTKKDNSKRNSSKEVEKKFSDKNATFFFVQCRQNIVLSADFEIHLLSTSWWQGSRGDDQTDTGVF
jgi:hypothetical protein